MPLPKGLDLKLLLQELDKRQELRGARVVYFDGATMSVLRQGPPVCQSGLLAVVLRKGGKDLVPSSAEIANARDQRFNEEVFNLGTSCGGALVSWIIAVSSAGAAPVTGGASLILTAVSSVAGVAGGVQCLNAGARMVFEFTDPQMNIDLDNQDWYTGVSSALDVIALAGSAASGAATVRMVLMLKGSTGKSLVAILRGLSRHERKRLTEEIIRAHNPGISNQEMKVLISKGIFPKRYHASEISRGLRSQLIDAVNSAVGVAGSAKSGVLNAAVSEGASHDYMFGVVSAFETF